MSGSSMAPESTVQQLAEPCFTSDELCPDILDECFTREESRCQGFMYSDRYDNASAAWVVLCAILMFFMKAGFLYLEESFSQSDRRFRRRVVLAKYIDIFGGTIGFWLFGYAISGNTDAKILGEEQDYIFWFFRFTFATNTATILGGTLVGQGVQLRAIAIFVYSFVMTAFIHPSLARFFWSSSRSNPRALTWSPYEYCNGTFTATTSHNFTSQPGPLNNSEYVFIDFAGSGLVHLCGGIGGFMVSVFHRLETTRNKYIKRVRECCFFLKREAMDETENFAGAEKPEQSEKKSGFLEWMYPSGGGEENVESAALGILILWTTWFAFNAGSAESISGKAIHAAVGRIALVMCLACASAGITQTIVSGLVQIYKRDETFNTNEIANAVLGALVAVTGCCPFIDPPWAILIGFISVGVYHLGCVIEWLLGLHDGARVFPVHGICGFWGVLCVGIFTKSCLIQELYEDLCFCVNSNIPSIIENQGFLFSFQLAGALFIMVWSSVLCTLLLVIIWFFPVKFALAFLPLICRFSDEERGVIKFEGNLLFTHFDEIGAPGRSPAPTAVQPPDPVSSLYKPPTPSVVKTNPGINISPEDTGYSSTNM